MYILDNILFIIHIDKSSTFMNYLYLEITYTL